MLIAVVGATATGKTRLGEALAGILGGEIVCADSRQLYAELEIGTGKPTPAERAARPHHLFDGLHLGQRASAGGYARAAREACDAIRARGRVPVLVGGSGLYLKSLREGLAPIPRPDPGVRERLQATLAREGVEALHARLEVVDPTTAGRLGRRDRQRITRALEVFESTGRPISWWHRRPQDPADTTSWTVLEPVVAPAALRGRIARRTRAMFEGGLIEETRELIAAGHGEALRGLRAIGYDEAMEHIAGRLSRADAEARVDLRTAQLAKRQRTWFRRQAGVIRLEGDGDDPDAVLVAARRLLGAA